MGNKDNAVGSIETEFGSRIPLEIQQPALNEDKILKSSELLPLSILIRVATIQG